ncbi:MAG: hypothetical protein E6K10_10690 [Methanobacteriota archaeon]|nr:MAG: hypothetical protein E6K10_10690 [Euryarchaeota archaeon]
MYLVRDQLTRAQVATAPPARTPGLRYAYYAREGTPIKDIKPESLEALKPKAEGKLDKVGLNIPNRASDAFALKFTGLIEAPRTGKYTFHLTSDDGSRLYLDGHFLIDNDGVHGGVEKSASAELKAGDHPLIITYFEEAGGEELKLSWEGPGVERQEVPASVLFSIGGRPMVPLGNVESFKPDPQRAAMGQRMFSVLGCASCHALTSAPPMRPAKALAALNVESPDGCLGEHVRKGLPQYHLGADQRASIKAALKNVASLNAPLEPAARAAREMAAMNCFACHVPPAAAAHRRGRQAQARRDRADRHRRQPARPPPPHGHAHAAVSEGPRRGADRRDRQGRRTDGRREGPRLHRRRGARRAPAGGHQGNGLRQLPRRRRRQVARHAVGGPDRAIRAAPLAVVPATHARPGQGQPGYAHARVLDRREHHLQGRGWRDRGGPDRGDLGLSVAGQVDGPARGRSAGRRGDGAYRD